jgi:autophagy-related protein 9
MDHFYSYLSGNKPSTAKHAENETKEQTDIRNDGSATMLPSPSLAMEMKDVSVIRGSYMTSPSQIYPPKVKNISDTSLNTHTSPSSSTSSQRLNRSKTEYPVALEIWKNYSNVDKLLELVYDFYQGGGRQPIMLEKYSSLAMVLFVVNFGLFLVFGIDWSFIHKPATAVSHPVLWEVASWPHMPILVFLCWAGFMIGWSFWLLKTIKYGRDLKDIEKIYEGLLGYDIHSMRNVDFDAIINSLDEVQQEHPLTVGSLDAHVVCNRLMRRDNYMIALFNKNILDLSLPFSRSFQVLTKQLEWNLNLCLMGFVFDDHFNVKKRFTRATEKKALVEELTQRFRFMALANLVMVPVIFVYLVFYFFLRYAEEIYRTPSSICQRSYSRLARWRFREFNELPHYFETRLEQSHRKALKMIDQFHNRRLSTIARLIGFIAGSLIAVLLLISLANEDLLMHFELTKGKSPIWYLPIFGLVLAICRSVLPDHSKKYDVRKLINQIVEYTHYSPPRWQNYRPSQIASEFKQLFRYRIVGISEDFLGVLAVPYLLWFQLPNQAEVIIDFFREFTVHVDGLGFVCSFALFDFQRPPPEQFTKVQSGTQPDGQDLEKQQLIGQPQPIQPGKMERSYLVFRGHHPQIANENPAGEELLQKLTEYAEHSSSQIHRRSSVVLEKMLNHKRTNIYDEDADENEEEDEEYYRGGAKKKLSGRGLMNLFDKFYHSSVRH